MDEQTEVVEPSAGDEETSIQSETKEIFSGNLPLSQALQKIRSRLLDLTSRNGLINYKHPKGKSLQFVDIKNIDALYEKLADGRPMLLSPVPEPVRLDDVETGNMVKRMDVREQAKTIGVDISYEIAPFSNDGKRMSSIQTLYYPPELEKQAKRIASDARTVIEETGSNMLYVVFGFLEFYESDDSDKVMLAPLISMPAGLTRGKVDPETKVYQYSLNYNGEDVTENITLREKLKQEFRLHLPEINEDTTPESYFSEVRHAVKSRHRWRVRRQVSIAMLTFGKLAIWADLDPNKHPDILDHELLGSLFKGSTASGSESITGEDYPIDTHPMANLPLIYDADSSQHSALIDALSGKNMVINGPPGTGKSQTITNIIASSLSEGKRVLFVSEKLAALEVVRHRLDMANLGHFCLELHSHKTQKKRLLEDIQARLDMKFTPPTKLVHRMAVLSEKKRQLQRYVELVSSKICNALDMTVVDVFWASERRRQELGAVDDALQQMLIKDASTVDHTELERRKSILVGLGENFKAAGGAGGDHPWFGLELNPLTPGDEQTISSIIEMVKGLSDQLVSAVSPIDTLGDASTDMITLQHVDNMLDKLPMSPDDIKSDCLASMFPPSDSQGLKSRRVLERVASILQQIERHHQTREQTLLPNRFPSAEDEAELTSIISVTLDQVPVFKTDVLRVPSSELLHAGNALASAAERFLSVTNTISPRFVTIPAGILADTTLAIQQLEEYGVGTTTLETLMERECNLRACHEQLQTFLDVVVNLTARWSLPFDGSPSAVQSLANHDCLSELSSQTEISDTILEQAKELAKSKFASVSIDTLENELAELRSVVQVMENSYSQLKNTAAETNHPFNGSVRQLSEMIGLMTIAVQAPVELLSFRSKTFEHPRFSDVLRRAKDDHEKELSARTDISDQYFLDSLPEVAELKWASRVFRQGDSVFNIFNGDWRKAKKLVKSMCQFKNKQKADHWSKECARIAEWIDHTKGYDSNTEYRASFGELFSGTKTNYEIIETLHTWYSSSNEVLMSVGSLSERIDLTSIDARKLGLLAMRSSTTTAASKTLDRQLSYAQEKWTFMLPSPHQTDWPTTIATLHGTVEELTNLTGFFKPLSQHQLSPKRTLELLEAKRDLIANQSTLTSMVHAAREIATACGNEFSGFAMRPVGDWKHRLAETKALAVNIAKLTVVIDKFVQTGTSPAQALQFLSAKKEFDDAVFRVVGASISSNAKNWDDYANCGKIVASHVERLITSLQKHARLEHPAYAIQSAVQAVVDAEKLLAFLSKDDEIIGVIGVESRGEKTSIQALDNSWQWGSIVATSDFPKFIKLALLSSNAKANEDSLRRQTKSAIGIISEIGTTLSRLNDFGTFDWQKWIGPSKNERNITPLQIAQRTSKAQQAIHLLMPWSKYVTTRNICKQSGFGALLSLLEDNKLSADQLGTAFERVFFQSLGKAIVKEYPELAHFSGEAHDRLRTEFRELDREIIKLNGLKLAYDIDANKSVPPGMSGMRVSELTEMQLLRKELGKSTKHIPIRQLVRRAGMALQALKPCFMMGPLSVAQYLQQEIIDFDVIVMDEASQLRPEEALGAVARGKQLIVVGDPKQLPPTNFFDRMMNNDDEEDDTASFEGSESILDICQQLFSPIRTLKWHYRSQHESLIAFSNFHFYRSELVVFPSPYERGKRLGVTWRYVRDGVYKDRRNVPEAQRVVDAAIEHMMKNPEESLGIVSLNQTQRELIQDIFDKKSIAFEETSHFMLAWKEKGLEFFIKNLENVQGDERDAIFVSATFGKAPGTVKPRQNFGPISRADGWRRLNVLFTRSRKRIVLFSSMLPEDIITEEKTPIGTKALRDYMDFARRGVLVETDLTDREPDSDFEVSVANVLSNHGYVVKPQLGVANFYLDMAIRNPDRPGEFLAGIECDGATYHRSASARDRDRIRQDILENLGWNGRIFRIWSTDWFYNPGRETKKMLAFLDERRRLAKLEPDLFEPNIENEDDDETPEEASLLAVIDDPINPDLRDESRDAFVEVGDTVSYCYLDNINERHTVTIQENAPSGVSGLINENKPLALALIGLQVGEIGLLVITGRSDRKVKILKIEHRTVED